MMQVRVVRMAVPQRDVRMAVGVRPGRRGIERMIVPMVFVVGVRMLVRQQLVGMLMFVSLGEV